MPQPENQQTSADIVVPLACPRRGLFEVLVFSFGSVVLGAMVPLYVVGLITVLLKFDFVQIKDFSLLLIIAAGGALFLIHDGGVWGIVGIAVWLLLALGSAIYFNIYFPHHGQRPWQKCLAFIVRACGGGAAAFGVTLNLWACFGMPGNGGQLLYGPAAIIAACIVGFFGALLAAYWPILARTRA